MQIFMSYSRVDKVFATRLADDLIAAGFNVWFDLRSIPSGAKWDLEVQRGLESSDVMLVLLSPTAAASDNVQDEWSYFISKGRRILPLLIQPTDVPFRLSRRQRIDFVVKSYEAAFSELLTALNDGLTGDARAPEVQTRTLNVSWGSRYHPWRGLLPIATGFATFSQSDIRLTSPNNLPINIPITSIADVQVRRRLWDSYLAIHFLDRASTRHELLMMGTDRKTRSITNKELISVLGSATGKVIQG
jgi:hypothetical protein